MSQHRARRDLLDGFVLYELLIHAEVEAAFVRVQARLVSDVSAHDLLDVLLASDGYLDVGTRPPRSDCSAAPRLRKGRPLRLGET